MPFDFHDFDRIKNLAEELRELRYRKLQDIPSFLFWEDSDRKSRVSAGEVGVGFSFRGWDKYYWLTAEVEIPQEFRGRKCWAFLTLVLPREPEIMGILKACSM